MTDPTNPLHYLTRRHFFSRCGLGLGSIALGSLLAEKQSLAEAGPGAKVNLDHYRESEPAPAHLQEYQPGKGHGGGGCESDRQSEQDL